VGSSSQPGTSVISQMGFASSIFRLRAVIHRAPHTFPGGSTMAKILIVDDEHDIRDLVATKLTGLGHEVITEEDGAAGLAAALEQRPDLVLLDSMMPYLTGPEVCIALRAHAEFAATPIILLSARAQQADLQQGYVAGATDYITKPFSPRELVGRVEAALAGTFAS
jgi:DNA-binding response OmpR family regulator